MRSLSSSVVSRCVTPALRDPFRGLSWTHELDESFRESKGFTKEGTDTPSEENTRKPSAQVYGDDTCRQGEPLPVRVQQGGTGPETRTQDGPTGLRHLYNHSERKLAERVGFEPSACANSALETTKNSSRNDFRPYDSLNVIVCHLRSPTMMEMWCISFADFSQRDIGSRVTAGESRTEGHDGTEAKPRRCVLKNGLHPSC